jgi:hypothetical protein
MDRGGFLFVHHLSDAPNVRHNFDLECAQRRRNLLKQGLSLNLLAIETENNQG